MLHGPFIATCSLLIVGIGLYRNYISGILPLSKAYHPTDSLQGILLHNIQNVKFQKFLWVWIPNMRCLFPELGT